MSGTARLTLKAGPKLALNVNQDHGRPVPGAGVTLVALGGTRGALGYGITVIIEKRCDAQGRLELNSLLPGDYQILAAGDEQRMPAKSRLTLKENEPSSITLSMVPWPGVLSGRVVDERGQPVAQASIKIHPIYPRIQFVGPNTLYPRVTTASTDREGTWKSPMSVEVGSDAQFTVLVNHPQYASATLDQVTSADLANPTVLHPPVSLTVELAPAEPMSAADLTNLMILVRPKNQMTPGLWFPFALPGMPTFMGFKVPGAKTPVYEFPCVMRSAPLEVVALCTGWKAGEPIVMEGEREVGHGLVTLPATGQPRWIVNVPMAKIPAPPAGPPAVGPLDVIFRDARDGTPLEGLRVWQGRLGMGPVAGMSRPDGSIHLELPGGNTTFWVGDNFIPLNLPNGRVVCDNRSIGIELTTGTKTQPGRPMEIRGFPAISGRVLIIQCVDGMGHWIHKGITVLDGSRKWSMLPQAAPPPIPMNSGIPMAYRGGPPDRGGQIFIPLADAGKTRLVFTMDGRRIENIAPQYQTLNGPFEFTRDGQGRPCLDVTETSGERLMRNITIQLTDYLELPEEGKSK